jgi:hypothetical protein
MRTVLTFFISRRLAPFTIWLLASVACGQTPDRYRYFDPHLQPLPLSSLSAEGEVAPVSASAPSQDVVPAQYGMGMGYGTESQTPLDGSYSSYSPGNVCPSCTTCPNRGYYGFFGYDSWRGIQDGSWGNNGLHAGVNFGTRLGPVSDWTGVGFQLGSSVGVYNFNGTDYHMSRNDQATMQGFVTYGFFRKANEDSPWSAGVVQDWMLTSNYGIFAENPTMAQWRGQVGYAFGPLNELGLWGTWRGQGDSRNVPFFGPTTWRPVQQLSVYWHYKWGLGGPDSWISFGVPEHDRLTGNGSLGDYVVSAITNCPLSDRVMLYAQVTYLHPSSSPGPAGATEDAWAFLIGLSFFPGRNARTETVAGQCWMPLMPVANNGYFLGDTSQLY